MVNIIESGFYTSIQDLGRFGYRNLGVPYAGVMDNYSSVFANTIIGNSQDMAVLEMTMTGPVLQFTKATIIGIAGANFKLKINGQIHHTQTAIRISAGDILSFERPTMGLRAYLAVKGGFKTKSFLGSRSMFVPISPSDRVYKGDSLPFEEIHVVFQEKHAHLKYDTSVLSSSELLATKGPEYHLLPNKVKSALTTQTFSITNFNNRMAYQIDSGLDHQLSSILTSPVLPGTVQLTPDGYLIVLLRDSQTTGGYPRVLQLDSRSINRLSQKHTGGEINFRIKD